MSLFRKPKKPAQTRVFTAVDDEDGDEMEVDAPPPPRIRERARDKPRKEKDEDKPKQTLLSFADEEEEGEVFRVKKSSQSKRLARARDREKRKVVVPVPIAASLDVAAAPAPAGEDTNSRDITHNDKGAGVEDGGAARRRSTLEGLVLSGRAALAAAADGDVSDDDDGGPERADGGSPQHDDAGFHRYRPESVRAALTKGQIPDAALIHAARKTRQQARETGRDFVPLSSDGGGAGVGGGAAGGVGGGGGAGGGGSRLVREDGSGDEEEEGRLAVRGIIVQNNSYKASDGADSGGEEWEAQQMLKAVPGGGGGGGGADAAGEHSLRTLARALRRTLRLSDGGGGRWRRTRQGMELNLFAVAPPAPSLHDAPAHLRPLAVAAAYAAPDAPAARPPATVPELLAALRERLGTLRAGRDSAAAETSELRARMLAAVRTRDARAARAPDLDAAYRRAQAARGYFTDLVECLDEKMPQLEALEARALMLHRRRCEYLVERRRTDVRDQAQDVLALAARAGAVRAPDTEEKVRRAAEREGRRRARRLARGPLAAEHRDGDSSDDETPPSEREHARLERESISTLASQLFADALPAWRSVRGVCARIARWRRADPRAYSDAYVAECLPKLLAPHVRAEMVLWNPLADEDNEDYEKMDWYKCLMMYGVRWEREGSDSDASEAEGTAAEEGAALVTERAVREDADLMLVPTVVHKVLLPKVTELVETAWDPMCVRATTRLRALLLRAAALPPRDSPARRRLAAESRARLQHALAADVFLPALPQPIMDGKGGAFWRRCLGAGVRLLRAVLSLCPPPDALAADALALRLVGTLCTAAGAAPASAAAAAAAVLASTLPRAPSELRRAALARIALLAAAALARLQPDNALHLKALEQARGVLSEAQAAGVS